MVCVCIVLTGGIFTASGEEKKEKKLLIKGEVVESMGNTPLPGTIVTLLDSAYNPIDTMTANNMGTEFHRAGILGGSRKPAYFRFLLPRNKATYYLQFEQDKYNTLIRPLTIDKLGSREHERDLGYIQLEKAPRQLSEVTVTATKVKFYHKGDTLVFNADAFELPEGSMLDALVAQMPGVEIKENGQIFVNGRFVDNLILNGKDFFKGDHTVMLQNLGSYMVKDVAVYEKNTEFNKFMGRDYEKKEFVMDVRLKKEYMHGVILNIEGGAGTNSRYMGRLFGMRYDDLTRVGVFVNVNNLSDNSRQGQSGGFDPAKMLPGSRKHQNAGLTFNASSRDNKVYSQGNLVFTHTGQDIRESVTRQNFLPGGDTYSYRFGGGYGDSHTLNGNAYVQQTTKWNYRSASIFENYSDYDNRNENIEATFNEELEDATRALLDSLYNPAHADEIGKTINRIASRSRSKGRNFRVGLEYSESFKIPHTNDAVSVQLNGNFRETRQQLMNLYRINIGQEAAPQTNQGQWGDSRPNRGYNVGGTLYYRTAFGNMSFQPYYMYDHSRKNNDMLTSIMNNLGDLGIYGLSAPAEAEYSADDSYRSTVSTNSHSLGFYGNGRLGNGWFLMVAGLVTVSDSHLWYSRFNRNYRTSRTSVLPNFRDVYAIYGWGEVASNYGKIDKNEIKLKYSLTGKAPELEWLLPITNDTDPMNIYEGAEKLKDQMNHGWELSWTWRDGIRPLNHVLTLSYGLQSNTLVRGYTYDTGTGVRRIRSYNTSGNWSEGANSILSLQFGPKRKMSLSNNAGISYGHATDMIGTNVETPAQSTIRNLFVTETLNLTWQVGKQNIGVKGNAIWRHSTGDREGFREINSATINYGLTGVFKLPLGFGLSTDLTMYMREGYDDPGLDKHDLVWNARLSRSLDKGRWVVMVDGFDLLHQLSNVTYAINAQGRTVTYTNSLPRYVLLHAIYRIDIKPKKR